ncbi:MAG TPA: pyridoxamine 5'-phosphate oxidase family protein [Anaerolineales bacterium]|nr:pyridoxamine 5'-phosphate oxidase family protein [Anaerolineales bacterium]
MSAKQVSKKNQSSPMNSPAASRPKIPTEYGIPNNNKGLLSWSHVTDRMTRALHYWICTVDPNGQPHVTPVDGLWLNDRLYFGGSPQTRRNRNLIANRAVSVHLDSSDDVVILHGEAHLQTPDHELAVQLSKASTEKYGYAPQPEDYEASGVQIFRPHTVFAWKQFPKDVTRWQLSENE